MNTVSTDDKSICVAVVGERNSSTNLAEVILGSIDGVRLVSTRAPGPIATVARLINSEWPLEAYFSLKRDRFWKHAEPDKIAKVQSKINLIVKTVQIVRDPWAWLVSMHRRPYHHPEAKTVEFSQFLRMPVPVLGRESSKGVVYDNPVQLWNTKVEQGLRLRLNARFWHILTSEQLLLRPDASIQSLIEYLGLPTDCEHPKLPRFGVKPSGKQVATANYREAYLGGRHLSSYTDEDIAFVCERLSASACAEFGYARSPALIKAPENSTNSDELSD